MILYFSGTGNSRYIAERIARTNSEEMISINDKVKNNDTSTITVQGKLVFVLPTYAWRIPNVVRDWIRKTEFVGANQVWFVMNCGSEIGNAGKYNKKLCEEKSFTYMGTAQIVMPENYIAMFDAPEADEAKEIISKAEPFIDAAVEMIAAGKAFPVLTSKLSDRLKSGLVYKMFYAFCVKADDFVADERCIGCGKCEKLCPMNNIKIEDGKPVWGKACTHCMACICYCPAKAVEYGKKSVGKPRYQCDLYTGTNGDLQK